MQATLHRLPSSFGYLLSFEFNYRMLLCSDNFQLGRVFHFDWIFNKLNENINYYFVISINAVKMRGETVRVNPHTGVMARLSCLLSDAKSRCTLLMITIHTVVPKNKNVDKHAADSCLHQSPVRNIIVMQCSAN
jgi:hypothetical protein